MGARVKMLAMAVAEIMQGETAYHGTLRGPNLLDWCPADLAHPVRLIEDHDLLEVGARQRFFPALWEVRSAMTDAWGSSYGRVRESIAHAADKANGD